MRAQGAIQRAEVDNSALVHTAWDLGSPLNTATWFFQIVGPEIRIVDCDSDLDLTPVQRVARMLAKGYFYGSHFLPHDAQVTQKSGKTFLTELNELGLRNCKAVPQTYDIWIGIKFFGEDCLLCRREPRRIGAIALKSSEKPHFFQIIRHPKNGWVRGTKISPKPILISPACALANCAAIPLRVRQ